MEQSFASPHSLRFLPWALCALLAGCGDDAGGVSDTDAPDAAASDVLSDGTSARDGQVSDSSTFDGRSSSSCVEWASTDVGEVEVEGEWSCDAGTYRVSGGGADIWSTEDSFYFLSQSLEGDGVLIAELVSFDANEPWAKAGVMFRESDRADAPHAHLLISYSADNPIKFDRRETAGGNTTGVRGPVTGAPYWLRLARRGAEFTAHVSADGAEWAWVGTQTIAMDAEVMAGLSVVSHEPGQLATGTFANVRLTAGPSAECGPQLGCATGSFCADGACVAGCEGPDDCAAGQLCEANACVEGVGFVVHDAILNNVFGYGAGATGGAGGRLIEVTNLNADGPGSLREAVGVDGPTWIFFTPGLRGTITLDQLLYLRSDTTIDGRGADVGIGGHTLNIFQSAAAEEGTNNVVLHNLKFTGGLPDGRSLVVPRYGHTMWFDHVTFAAQRDDGKPVALGDAATDITMSWCDFSTSQVSLILLISSDNESPGDSDIRFTGHHNLFEGTNERHPRVRYATIHWLNNAVIDWEQYGSSISQNGFFLAEGNIYEAGRTTRNAIITRIGNFPANGDPFPGNLRMAGNWWKNGTIEPEPRNPETVLEPPYEYEVETADDMLLERLRRNVGWQDVPSPFEESL